MFLSRIAKETAMLQDILDLKGKLTFRFIIIKILRTK